MRTGVHENCHLTCHAVLPAQLFCSALGKLGDRSDEIFQPGHSASETAGAGNLFLRRRLALQVDAGHALQLTHRALEHNAPAGADHRLIEPHHVQRSHQARVA